MDDQLYSTSESESYSPALPSLAYNFDAAVQQESCRVMTMKETDAKMDQLRRENLNLKLRLYIMETQKGSVTSLNSGSIGSAGSMTQLNRVLEGDIISKEISKRESALRNAQMLLEEKDLEIEMLKGDLESIGRERDDQSELFRQEKQSLMQQLQSLEEQLLKSTSPTSTDLQSRLKSCEQELANVKGDFTFVRNECHLKSRQINEFQAQIKKQEQELIELRAKSINQFDSTVHTYKFMLDEKDMELETFKNENERLMKEMNANNELLNTYKQMLTQTRTELDQAKIESKNFLILEKDNLQTLRNTLEHKEAQLIQMNSYAKRLEQQLQQLQDGNVDLNNVQDSLTTFRPRINLLNELRDKNAQIEQLKREQHKHAIENRDEVLSTYKGLLDKKEEEIERLRNQLQPIESRPPLDESVEAYKFMLMERETEMDLMKAEFEVKLKEKHSLIERGVIERERLLMELADYKVKKDNIEKVITKQLKKTDKLLKKAKINLIETS